MQVHNLQFGMFKAVFSYIFLFFSGLLEQEPPQRSEVYLYEAPFLLFLVFLSVLYWLNVCFFCSLTDHRP